MYQRAAERHPLLHAAGQLTRKAFLEAAKTDKVDQVHGALARFDFVEPQDFGGQQDVVEHGAPLQEHGVLKHNADVAGGAQERHAVK